MKFQVSLSTVFNCTQERAFRAPILGDATKFLNGYRFQPAVIRFEDDKTWGQPGGHRFPITKGNFWMKAGRTFRDEIVERKENEYWQWKIFDFQAKSLWFVQQAVGEWTVNSKGPDQQQVTYSYTFTPKSTISRPFLWIFLQIQWRGMMQKALTGIQQQAESQTNWVYPV